MRGLRLPTCTLCVSGCPRVRRVATSPTQLASLRASRHRLPPDDRVVLTPTLGWIRAHLPLTASRRNGEDGTAGGGADVTRAVDAAQVFPRISLIARPKPESLKDWAGPISSAFLATEARRQRATGRGPRQRAQGRRAGCGKIHHALILQESDGCARLGGCSGVRRMSRRTD
ncbi:hypothetical protein CC85DRAFT_33040 [Cutaneotrichosporon oleaginosum]|uniref:Uncharacterized protein n=1 Tax=Cutaneotrichosporon oleaginosum TaxID=879819 RepID=A0A0J0XST3_9TREE|nr:uncharacterized protein CC85DRAFT_33040 [Cutaneotrichosporon oleaginosum]KLT44166.1 hypothetical protein CC85DRAFT_33040 [Cutaneotrichosporon oleaginosum]TXT09379.1 hypothetical protein COLE_03313 [Cutaneotrichosporon oleaginosum]